MLQCMKTNLDLKTKLLKNYNLEVFFKEKNLVNTYYEKEKNVWEYKLAFDKREDLNLLTHN